MLIVWYSVGHQVVKIGFHLTKLEPRTTGYRTIATSRTKGYRAKTDPRLYCYCCRLLLRRLIPYTLRPCTFVLRFFGTYPRPFERKMLFFFFQTWSEGQRVDASQKRWMRGGGRVPAVAWWGWGVLVGWEGGGVLLEIPALLESACLVLCCVCFLFVLLRTRRIVKFDASAVLSACRVKWLRGKKRYVFLLV